MRRCHWMKSDEFIEHLVRRCDKMNAFLPIPLRTSACECVQWYAHCTATSKPYVPHILVHHYIVRITRTPREPHTDVRTHARIHIRMCWLFFSWMKNLTVYILNVSMVLFAVVLWLRFLSLPFSFLPYTYTFFFTFYVAVGILVCLRLEFLLNSNRLQWFSARRVKEMEREK